MPRHLVITVGNHEPVSVDLGLAQVHEVRRATVLRPYRNLGHLGVVVVRPYGRGDHDDDLREGMVLVVECLDEVEGPVEEPLGDDEGYARTGRVPRRVELCAVDDVLGAEVARDQIRGCVVMDDWGVLERILPFPNVGPLLEHLDIVRQGDVLPLLVEHDLRRELGNDPERPFDPHLRHAVVVRNGVVGTGSLDLELPDESLEEGMGRVVYGVPVRVVEERYWDLLVEVVPLVAVVLGSQNCEGPIDLNLAEHDVKPVRLDGHTVTLHQIEAIEVPPFAALYNPERRLELPIRPVDPAVQLLLRAGDVQVQLLGDVRLDGIDVVDALTPPPRFKEAV
mmetsp:Transcript_6573/g.14902  ORF Transcript_6573/g.14902 Transcript_6573/m.14902 type:complete len:337 (-) Transcript_6573:1317-2327(-)